MGINKLHRKRSNKQVTNGNASNFFVRKMEDIKMQNTKILKMLNNGQIEELKALIKD